MAAVILQPEEALRATINNLEVYGVDIQNFVVKKIENLQVKEIKKGNFIFILPKSPEPEERIGTSEVSEEEKKRKITELSLKEIEQINSLKKKEKKAAEIIKELNLDCCVSTFNRWVKKEMPNIEQIDMGKVGALLKAGWDTKKIAIEFRLSEEHTDEIIKRYREEVEQG